MSACVEALVGWLVGCSPRGSVFGCLWASSWGGGVRRAWWVPRGLVCARDISRERACLREVCGRVGDVEGVAFVEELFCLVCGDYATTDGRPLSRVFAACGDGEELGGELWCGYWLCHVFAVWAGVAECGVLGEWSDSLGAAVGFER